MNNELKSVEYFLLCLMQDTILPLFIAVLELMSAVCALSNFYGSRRRFPPGTQKLSARSPNPYPQIYDKYVISVFTPPPLNSDIWG